MVLEIKEENFTNNGYMKGACPSCGEWEAPITEKELKLTEYKHCHLGSSTPIRDLKTCYYRETWKEFFKCPKCTTQFYVTYSST